MQKTVVFNVCGENRLLVGLTMIRIVLSLLLYATASAAEMRELVTNLPKDFLPEGIEWDNVNCRFLLSSIRKNEIVAVDPTSGQASDFGKAPGSVLGIHGEGDSVWAVWTRFGHAFENNHGTGIAAWSLRDKRCVGNWPLPTDDPRANLGDFLIVNSNSIVASDSGTGAVWKFDMRNHQYQAIVPPGTFKSPQGLALGRVAGTIYLADYSTGLWRISLANGERTNLAAPSGSELRGIDGLYRRGNQLIAVQNGTKIPRIIIMTLGETDMITDVRALLALGAGDDEPVLGMLSSDTFWFVANGQWSQYDDDLRPKTEAKLQAPRLRAISLDMNLPPPQPTLFAQQNSATPSPTVSKEDTARYEADIRRIEEALPKVADRGAALFILAARRARLGQGTKALATLKECVSLDEGFDPTESKAFESLRSNREFQSLTEEARRHYPRVHRARVAFTVEKPDLFPEGMAADAKRRIFYFGSIIHRNIIKTTVTGAISDFVRAGRDDLFGMNGVRVDPADHSVWAASASTAADRGALVHFDSQGNLLERFAITGVGPHSPNDLEVRGSRELYVTDTLAHVVYRFDRIAHSFTPMTFPRPLLYPNGITLSDNGNSLYIADSLGLIVIDLDKNTMRDVDPGQHSTLAGIDGLYWYKGDLIGVQYGTGPYRVARWKLSPDGLRVTSTEILEYRTPEMSFPTTGAIMNAKFYFMLNTGIGNLKDDEIIDRTKLEPVRVAVISLG
jgi:sugar lactone lactonase YvrE